ncbi:hypothetical protein [Treponema sp.]|uniref:hypothetical protein n=1 Tax=Treponema sp. TaxID=166 RepID=UPI00298E4FED|nr:hypothetical protein [Treponema sp.]MCQ2240553.1 hypothetical protein [Treponema sp.]
MCGNLLKRMFSPVAVCFFLCFFLFTACGLETLYYLEPPTSSREILDNEDRERDYFSFYTGDNSGVGSEFDFQGTQVYYKIFSDSSSAKSSYLSISSYNSSSDVSAAANYIINTKKYVQLNTLETSESPFIKGNRTAVEIRLNRIASYADKYPNYISVGETRYSPKRYHTVGSKKVGFEFSKEKDKDENPVPKSGDEDVDSSFSSSGSGEYYVDAWAFSQGRDNSYTFSYSRALHLGCIKISAREYDN